MSDFKKTVCGNPAAEHQNKGVMNLKTADLKTKIKINEIFGPTIQGEGKSAGKEVLFLRTATCNLACIWCDTPYTWNWKGTKFQHPDKYDSSKELKEMSNEEILDKLRDIGPNVKALVISGGEPMLQQKKLISLLQTLKQDNYWIEIETNGTIVPDDDFIELLDQVNCSPKLTSSGPDNKKSMRERPKALTKLAQNSKVCFKFVVQTRADILEILELVKRYNMKNVYLMPEGRTKEEQEARQDEIQHLAQVWGFEFSPRLHILRWGTKRGV